MTRARSYRDRSFIASNVSARTHVTPLAATTGIDCVSTPQITHKTTPVVNARSIQIERSSTDFVRHALITCGTKANVVSVPATAPMRSADRNRMSSNGMLTVLSRPR